MSEALINFTAQYLIFFSAFAFPYLWFQRKGHRLIQIAVTVILAFALAELIKSFLYVPRPFVAEGFTPLFPHEPDGSFPSSHVTILAALAGSVLGKERALGILLVLMAIGVGVGRVLAGVHYPLDVGGGLVLGLGGAALVRALHRRFPVW